MGFEIHIEREDQAEISLEDWCSAIDAVEGTRLATSDAFGKNPVTGEQIRITRREGDAEVYFPDLDSWIPCLWFSRGRISFRPSDDFDEPSSPFRQTMIDIASQLEAKIVDDEGHTYS